jgi:hypothetical protein
MSGPRREEDKQEIPSTAEVTHWTIVKHYMKKIARIPTLTACTKVQPRKPVRAIPILQPLRNGAGNAARVKLFPGGEVSMKLFGRHQHVPIGRTHYPSYNVSHATFSRYHLRVRRALCRYH